MGWNGDVFGWEICVMVILGGWLILFLKDNYLEVDYGIILLFAGK